MRQRPQIEMIKGGQQKREDDEVNEGVAVETKSHQTAIRRRAALTK